MSVYGYRRGSIFWALTLIAVGTIFLYHNFNPAVQPWQIIAKYWPVLIIFWGLSKLIDYVQARAHPETVPPPLFSGSEVLLLILILLLGTAVSKIVLRPWQQWPAALGIDVDDEDFASLFLESYTYTQTLSQEVKPPDGMLVVIRRGDVEVHGADQKSIEAVVKETIRAPNEEDAKKLSDQLKFSLVEKAGRYLLETNLDSLPADGRNVRLDVTLRVPKATTTEITTERGDIIIDGLQGEQVLTTKRGDVHVANVEGLVRIHKSGGSSAVRDIKGSVEVDGRGRDVEASEVTGSVMISGDFSGSMQFRNVAQTLRYNSSRTDLTLQKLTGRLNMELGSLDATGIDGPFEVSTKQKDISVADFTHSIKITDTNGDVRLQTRTPPTQPMDVDLRKGQIDLTLPGKSSFTIEATSRHGRVDSDFSGSGLAINNEGATPSITGTYGKGGPTIRLSTSYGTIRLNRQGTAPVPPPPPPAPSSSGGNET
jgi:hypothetical protein